ncbi:hypothetical protein [Paractinoplanes atraurantiacus]|uniref:Uncharacterized protein n=1 Tax=Paractinoplanes atraurantiacus TaxID=1036182 RepID=A0A285HE90_9ACTN|nr:hypothetical protein [Actinoplanes atraurantiacus]SNY33977.1 hypothetical protein SAMN05421748_104212 [Actinoplanes atraurantiacus]
MDRELYVGIDATKIVVSARPIKVRTGRVSRHRAGSVTEMLPVAPSGATREERTAFACRLSLPLAFLTALAAAAGAPWWLPAVASVVTVAAVWRRQARAAAETDFELPRDPQARVLLAAEERAVLQRAVRVARRVRRAWPALPGMVDEAADHSLTSALDDLATLLVRRQELRRLRSGLAAVPGRDVPEGSPALSALSEQRDQAERLWREAGREVNRILRSLDRTALAQESLLRERHIGETARHAELALAGLAPAATVNHSELADRTDAVITAYRELEAGRN